LVRHLKKRLANWGERTPNISTREDKRSNEKQVAGVLKAKPSPTMGKKAEGGITRTDKKRLRENTAREKTRILFSHNAMHRGSTKREKKGLQQRGPVLIKRETSGKLSCIEKRETI